MREKLKRTSIQVAPSALSELAKLAKKNCRTRSAQIRLAVQQAIDEARKNGKL